MKDEIERAILDSNLSKQPMGPDGLPLNFPYNSGDGEGRLKGEN